MATLIISLVLVSCWPNRNRPDINYNQKVLGLRPLYGADSLYKKLTFHSTAMPLTKVGKIFVYGNMIFQNDVGKGIHLIDNRVPAVAHRIAFIELPGNTEMAVSGHFIYANNFNDLVVIDISNITAFVEVRRLKNMFAAYNSQQPYPWQAPSTPGFYECPRMNNDSVVIGWVADSVYQYCYQP